MVNRQEVSRVLLFCANIQNVSGISDSLTSVVWSDIRTTNLSSTGIVKSSVLSIKHSCGPGGSLLLRKLMFDCVIEVQHLDIEFSSLESLDDITVPCTELVAVVLLGLCSRLS